MNIDDICCAVGDFVQKVEDVYVDEIDHPKIMDYYDKQSLG